jgi:murein DD-endopeptidase MepM/ murein hydrolase activator NlpD
MFYVNWPCKGRISSKFGWRLKPKAGWHSGLDLAVPTGTSCKACYKGKVVFAGNRGNYGKCVILLHESIGRVWSLYAHLSRITVKVGKVVTEGQEIAFTGNTGYSTGPHLHFELRVGVNGIAFAKDPLKHLNLNELGAV